MPVYEYKALNVKGRSKSGLIDAEGSASARLKLKDQSLFPTEIREVSDQMSTGGNKFSFSFFSRIPHADISMMTRQLATLLTAGFPLVRAINVIINQMSSQTFRKALSKIKDAIEEGSSFADALKPYPSIFSHVYINMVKAGESSGTLDIVLDRLADISEKQQKLKNKIQVALAYPILMGILGSAVLFVLLTFIVPGITQIFIDMEHDLPPITNMLIAFSDFMKNWWWALLIFIAISILSFSYAKKTKKGSYFMDRALLSIPLLRNTTRKLAAARFSRMLGSLLENGITVLPAMKIVENVTGNSVIAEAIEKAGVEVEKGMELGKALEKTNAMPYLTIQMIMVGEESGELEAMLERVADIFENEVETSISVLTSIIEPLMILIMAVVVGLIVVSIALPIFEMNEMIK